MGHYQSRSVDALEGDTCPKVRITLEMATKQNSLHFIIFSIRIRRYDNIAQIDMRKIQWHVEQNQNYVWH